MKENIFITSIAFVTVGGIILITNSVPKDNYYVSNNINNIQYKEMMNKIDDLDKRLKKLEK